MCMRLLVFFFLWEGYIVVSDISMLLTGQNIPRLLGPVRDSFCIR